MIYRKTELRDDIMSRIESVRGLRAFSRSPMAPIFFALVLTIFSSIVVSLKDVIKNIMANSYWHERFFYAYSSLVHSRFIVQVLAVLIIISCLMIIINSRRRFFMMFGFARQV